MGHGDVEQQTARMRPEGPIVFSWIAFAWIAGLTACDWTSDFFGANSTGVLCIVLSLAVTCLGAAVLMLFRHHPIASRYWTVLGLFFAAFAWWNLFVDRAPQNDVTRWLGPDRKLVEAVGRVVGPTRMSTQDAGAFAKFAFMPPSTQTVLEIESIFVDGFTHSVDGKILLRVGEADLRLRDGIRIRVRGSLVPIDGPMNPGEFDYQRLMSDRGIHARLLVSKRADWKLELDSSEAAMPSIKRASYEYTFLSRRASDAASASLRTGLPSNPQELALIDALLLGRWDRALGDLNQSFRRAGLTHLLAISGANLTILLGIVWAVVRVVTGRPRFALVIVLVALMGYLFILPPQVPILRAGIMATVFCLASISGRASRAIDSLALAATAVLIWRPQDLYDAGFQLSFGGVAAILLLTPTITQTLAPGLLAISPRNRTFAQTCALRGIEYVAASLAVWVVTFPLIAFHFHAITPMGGFWTMLFSPVFSLLMGVAYFKMMIGIWLPTVGLAMAWPVHALLTFIVWLVESAAAWRWSMIDLPVAPGIAWTLAALAVLWSLCAGWFHYGGGRFAVAILRTCTAILVCAAWLIVPQTRAEQAWSARGAHGEIARPLASGNESNALKINVFSVGDGSCFLLRIPLNNDHGPREHVLMFDCGSQQYLSVGVKSIAPAISRIGVSRIDTVMLSHADLDHYCGLLDTMDQVPVARVVTTRQLLQNAAANPESAVAHLIRGIEARKVPITAIEKGWQEQIGAAKLEVLWPTADFRTPKTNDTSMVLAAQAAGRRVLLTGDIQKAAIRALLKSGSPLAADISDLPHHGGWVDVSPQWIRAVHPLVVMQSCGHRRDREDKWPDWFVETASPRGKSGRAPQMPDTFRLMTARVGFFEVAVAQNGRITWRSFRTVRPIAPEP